MKQLARQAPESVRRRWAQMLSAPPLRAPHGHRRGAGLGFVHNWYGPAETAQRLGQNVSWEDFQQSYSAVMPDVLDVLGNLQANGNPFAVPDAARDDVAHIVVLWMWENLGQLIAAGSSTANFNFIQNAAVWMKKFGSSMQTGKPSEIRWDLVNWRAGLQNVNFQAYAWDALNNLVAGIPELNRNEPTNPPPIQWSGVVWDDPIPSTTLSWADIPWANIPWGSVNWSIFKRYSALFFAMGLNPEAAEYTGPLEALKGKLLPPTSRILAKIAEDFPGKIDVDLIPSGPKAAGWKAGGQPYLDPKFWGGFKVPVKGTTDPGKSLDDYDVDPEIAQGEAAPPDTGAVEPAAPAAPPEAPPASSSGNLLLGAFFLTVGVLALAASSSSPSRRRTRNRRRRAR